MKYNCFEYMNKMLNLSLELLEKQPDSQSVTNILKESEKKKKAGLQGAIKEFLPPIDREDITDVLCIIHTLNYCLAYLQNHVFSVYNTQYKSLTKDIISYMQYAICAEIRIPVTDFTDSIERMHSKLFSAIQDERIILSNENSVTTFNIKNLIKSNFFDRIEAIHQILHRLTGEITRIMVKFS